MNTKDSRVVARGMGSHPQRYADAAAGGSPAPKESATHIVTDNSAVIARLQSENEYLRGIINARKDLSTGWKAYYGYGSHKVVYVTECKL